jgi:exonuclease SbcD
MKILLTSDWHADARTLGHARFDDVDRAVRQTVDAAIKQKVDAYCFLGDLCDPDSGSSVFRSVELAISTAVALSREGILNVWLAGNHDVIEDGSGDTTLSPLRPLVSAYAGLTYLFERPGTVLAGQGLDKRAVFIRALPYTATSHGYDPTEHVGRSTKVDARMTANTYLIVLAHLAVEGVQPGEETKEMPRGRDVTFPRVSFPEEDSTTHLFNGHYHRQQTHGMPGYRPVHIPGAPARFTFGEQDNEPGYLLVEV